MIPAVAPEWWALVRWSDESPRMIDADPDDAEWREWLPVVAWAEVGDGSIAPVVIVGAEVVVAGGDEWLESWAGEVVAFERSWVGRPKLPAVES